MVHDNVIGNAMGQWRDYFHLMDYDVGRCAACQHQLQATATHQINVARRQATTAGPISGLLREGLSGYGRERIFSL
jgi:hypothetical protein